MNQPEREAFVAALLTGELSLDDPQVQARLREDPELQIMVDRMRDVETEVARATVDLAEILGKEPQHDDRVRAAVEQVVAERQRARRRSWLFAAAALLVGLVAGWYFVIHTPARPDDVSLGSEPGLEPQGMVKAYSPFRWDIPASGGRFEVSIYNVIDGKKGTLLLTTGTENVTSPWTMRPADEAGLPDEIWWELRVIGGDEPTHHAHARRQR